MFQRKSLRAVTLPGKCAFDSDSDGDGDLEDEAAAGSKADARDLGSSAFPGLRSEPEIFERKKMRTQTLGCVDEALAAAAASATGGVGEACGGRGSRFVARRRSQLESTEERQRIILAGVGPHLRSRRPSQLPGHSEGSPSVAPLAAAARARLPAADERSMSSPSSRSRSGGAKSDNQNAKVQTVPPSLAEASTLLRSTRASQARGDRPPRASMVAPSASLRPGSVMGFEASDIDRIRKICCAAGLGISGPAIALLASGSNSQFGSRRASQVSRFTSRRTTALLEAHTMFRHDCLKQVKALSDCDEGFVEQLMACVQPAVFSEGETIIEEGDETDTKLFILIQGSVSVEKGDVPITELHNGAIFGDMAALVPKNAGVRTATVKALSFCECRTLERGALNYSLKLFPNSKSILARQAIQRQRELTQRGLFSPIPKPARDARPAFIRSAQRRGTVMGFEKTITDRRRGSCFDGQDASGGLGGMMQRRMTNFFGTTAIPDLHEIDEEHNESDGLTESSSARSPASTTTPALNKPHAQGAFASASASPVALRKNSRQATWPASKPASECASPRVLEPGSRRDSGEALRPASRQSSRPASQRGSVKSFGGRIRTDADPNVAMPAVGSMRTTSEGSLGASDLLVPHAPFALTEQNLYLLQAMQDEMAPDNTSPQLPDSTKQPPQVQRGAADVSIQPEGQCPSPLLSLQPSLSPPALPQASTTPSDMQPATLPAIPSSQHVAMWLGGDVLLRADVAGGVYASHGDVTRSEATRSDAAPPVHSRGLPDVDEAHGVVLQERPAAGLPPLRRLSRPEDATLDGRNDEVGYPDSPPATAPAAQSSGKAGPDALPLGLRGVARTSPEAVRRPWRRRVMRVPVGFDALPPKPGTAESPLSCHSCEKLLPYASELPSPPRSQPRRGGSASNSTSVRRGLSEMEARCHGAPAGPGQKAKRPLGPQRRMFQGDPSAAQEPYPMDAILGALVGLGLPPCRRCGRPGSRLAPCGGCGGCGGWASAGSSRAHSPRFAQ